MTQALIDILRNDFEAKSKQFESEIQELRQLIAEGQISVERAHARIDALEKMLADLRAEMEKISKDLGSVKETVQHFSPKLDKFMDNLWKLVFLMLVLIAGMVGVKLM